MSVPARSTKFLRVALAYVSRNWFVFPCQPRSKIPFPGTQGFREASRNPDHVTRWWTEHPFANIALWPGPSGLVVIDVDGPEAEERAREWGLLAEPTLTAISGRENGGRHLYFKAPDFVVTNGNLDKNLDVRGHNGYVMLPPSIHPDTGRVYAWDGKLDELKELPPRVLARLRELSDGAPVEPQDRPISGGELGEGSRNNTLTRVAGNLLVKHPVAEATELLMAYNVANCKPPLSRREVEGIIASLSKREVKKPSRVTETGRVLQVAGEVQSERPLPLDLTIEQVEAAKAWGRRDFSDALRWRWRDLDRLVGQMLRGDLVIVGAGTGQGKTSYVLSQIDENNTRGIRTLVFPLEIDPLMGWRRWAAWALGYDHALVARNEWQHLPDDAQEQHEAKMGELSQGGVVQFVPDRQPTLDQVEDAIQWGVEKHGSECVFIDHLHRLDYGQGFNYRVEVSRAARRLKDLARKYNVVLIGTAQLNQDADRLDKYFPPVLKRLKESSAFAEESDLVLMLSRRLRSDVSNDDMKLIRLGHKSERDFEDPGVMVVTCRKCRLDDRPRDRSVKLQVEHGRVIDRAPDWRVEPHSTWEPA